MADQKRPTDIDMFRDFHNKYEGAKKIASKISPQASASDRTEARGKLRKIMGVADHIVPAESAYEAEAAAQERAAVQTLYGHFESHRDGIVDALSRKTLEGMALDIMPVEFPENRKYSPEHNELAELHVAYIAIKKTNEKFIAQETPRADYVMNMAKIASERIATQMSQNEYLDEQTVKLFATARAQLVGSSDDVALAVGRGIEKEAKDAFTKRAKELANPAPEHQDRKYTLADYAANNIRYTEEIPVAIGYAAAVDKASNKPKK